NGCSWRRSTTSASSSPAGERTGSSRDRRSAAGQSSGGRSHEVPEPPGVSIRVVVGRSLRPQLFRRRDRPPPPRQPHDYERRLLGGWCETRLRGELTGGRGRSWPIPQG